MNAVPLGEARDRLSEYVADVERTHERVTITRHGRPAAVLISADDLASIEETLEIFGTPGAAQAIREGQAAPRPIDLPTTTRSRPATGSCERPVQGSDHCSRRP